jgi:hypothetical protein
MPTLSHRTTQSVWALRHDPRTVPRWARVGDSVTSEATLAWALADIVSVGFTAHDSLGIFTALGAGDAYAAVERMLDIAVRQRYPLPATLLGALAGWLDCYVGDEHEPTMRSLLNRVEPQAPRAVAPSRRGHGAAKIACADAIMVHTKESGLR